MGRRNIMRISSADVNVAGYANLVDKIKKFEAAEEDFYNSRKNALQDYPGKCTINIRDSQLRVRELITTRNFDSAE